MKIGSLPPIAPVDSGGHHPRHPDGEPDEATRVTLSKDATFVAQLRDRASPAPFRQDMVAQVKAELANGTFEQNTNLDRVIDGLLADL